MDSYNTAERNLCRMLGYGRNIADRFLQMLSDERMQQIASATNSEELQETLNAIADENRDVLIGAGTCPECGGELAPLPVEEDETSASLIIACSECVFEIVMS